MERTRLLEAIRAQAQRVQQIMETVPEGVLLIDARNVVVLANPQPGAIWRSWWRMPGDVPTHWGTPPDELLSPPQGFGTS